MKYVKRLLLLFIVSAIFLSSCTETTPIKNKVIAVQPFDDFPSADLENIIRQLKTINPNIILRKCIPLPAHAYYEPRNRYRADSLINYLNRFADADTVVIGLTGKDISTTKNNYPDWGVMGLGFCPGNACVVSTYRLAKEKQAEQFYKLCVHELGHTQGLPHCPEKTCYMRDADGGNPLDEETGFCEKCKAYLICKGWRIG